MTNTTHETTEHYETTESHLQFHSWSTICPVVLPLSIVKLHDDNDDPYNVPMSWSSPENLVVYLLDCYLTDCCWYNKNHLVATCDHQTYKPTTKRYHRYLRRDDSNKEEKKARRQKLRTKKLTPSKPIVTMNTTRPQLPESLEMIQKSETFHPTRHRWNTNEEIASILIGFDKHEEWLSKEVKVRPKSGTMILYSRKRVRYRRDGYCWKKRKDGKTTREDHMKLKVQGTECIYGCYVHSAILPTFHRRCYWLLQNPDIVLVHYLNVPYTDDNKIISPTLNFSSISDGKKEWTRDELISELKPMCEWLMVLSFSLPGSSSSPSSFFFHFHFCPKLSNRLASSLPFPFVWWRNSIIIFHRHPLMFHSLHVL